MKRSFCQSCGMPMDKDPKGGGTNTDGTLNKEYCSFCYVNGDFTFKGTVNEMQEMCKNIMIDKGTNRLMAWLFTRGMKRLNRWKV